MYLPQQHEAVTTSALAQVLLTSPGASDPSSRRRSLMAFDGALFFLATPGGLGCLTSCVSVCSQNEGLVVQPHWEAGFSS